MVGVMMRIGLLVVLCFVAQPVYAHESRPALLEIKQEGPVRFSFVWKVPVRDGTTPLLTPRFPAGCKVNGRIERWNAGDAEFTRGDLTCKLQDFTESPIAIDGIEDTILEALVRFEGSDGSSSSMLLSRSNPSSILPKTGEGNRSLRSYFTFGIEHILTGFDHLLFLVCLVLLISDWRRLAYSVTAFSGAHATTLAAVSLGVMPRPGAVIEPLIALSILLLAVEANQAIKGRRSLLQTYPFAIVFAFGLLHGCGFASALTDVGFPKGDRVWALLNFNLGIETGQLLFIALLFGSIAIVQKAVPQSWPNAKYVLAFSVGCIAAYWTLERSIELFTVA